MGHKTKVIRQIEAKERNRKFLYIYDYAVADAAASLDVKADEAVKELQQMRKAFK